MRVPGILGGAPAFAEPLPFARPFLPPLERVMARLAPSYERGMLTNAGLVRELEAAVAERLDVPHVVAVSSCTSGLMLVMRAVAGGGPVVVPSFTFSASAHAIAWTGAQPLFCECDPDTFMIDPVDAAAKVALGPATTVLATHVFGAPAPVDALEQLSAETGVALVFDAAHAFGASRSGRPVGGFGDAEVFSLTPTKPLVAGEGGLVTTHRADIAEAVRLGRDYANPGDYDSRFVGLNARMSELHAALALESLVRFEEHLSRRAALAVRYRAALATIPGIHTQVLGDGEVTTNKDFTIAIDPDVFGLDRDALVLALRADGIDTRNYFSPPVHRQQAYRAIAGPALPVTDLTASRVVSLPMWGDLPADAVDAVCEVIAAVHARAAEIKDQAA